MRNFIRPIVFSTIGFLISFSAFAKSERVIASWTASAQPVSKVIRVSDITLKQTVHLSLAGHSFRVRFSNIFGKETIRMAAASAGEHQLLFHGSKSVEIPSGEEITSDWINFPVASSSDLTIEIYLRESNLLQTAHFLSLATSTNTNGDHVLDQAFAPSGHFQNWYLISEVDVAADSNANTLVAFGDSITDGAGSPVDANQRWPDFLTRRLQQKEKPISVVNEGISANCLLTDQENPKWPSSSGLKRFDHDAIGQPGVSAVIVALGINDIGLDHSDGSGELIFQRIIAGYEALIQKAHLHRIKLFAATLTPIGNSAYDSPAHRQARTRVNEWIRTSGKFDSVIDFDLAVRDSTNPEILRKDFDSGDHLHPNSNGYRSMVGAIDLEKL